MSNTLNLDVKTSTQVTDIAERMKAITSKMSATQKAIIAGQYERDAILVGLSDEVNKLEKNLKGFNSELTAMNAGFETAKGHYRKLAETMGEYLAKSAQFAIQPEEESARALCSGVFLIVLRRSGKNNISDVHAAMQCAQG